MAGGNGDGIFTLCDYFGPNLHWHTGDPGTDPWMYRMRVLSEESGIGYGKLFMQKGGYMTKEWAPCFIALKRQGKTYEEIYAEGHLSYMEKSVCDCVLKNGEASFTDIKAVVGGKGLEAALARLQTNMLLTISGQIRKLSRENVPYGWPVTTFQLADDFWGFKVMESAAAMPAEEAARRIREQISLLNPGATAKAIERFLR